MARALVTLDEAKARLRVFIDDEDADIQAMVEEATAAVITRVDNTEVTDLWTDDSPNGTPPEALAAVLEMTLDLYERDTTMNQVPAAHGRLPERVERLLTRLIKPAMA
jgi:Phage gp6-like head-tail connector protein